MAQYLNDPLTSREHDPSAAIRLESLTKTFRAPNGGTITAVDDVSFTIDRGEVVAFLGPNGAGKSTTIDLALGLLGPDSGSARIFGLDPITAAHAGLVSAVMQSGGMLPDLTVRDLMHMVGGLFREAEVDRCMARANIDELADRKISTCSGGEIQRVRFGMALIPNPELMILDEPTAAMDVEARRTFWERVHEDADRGRTVVFATHYIEEADQFADRVILIQDGRIIADDTADNIRAASSGRIASCVLPADAARTVLDDPGVSIVKRSAGRTYLHSTDSDALVGDLVRVGATDIEVLPQSLEDAFLTLTRKN